MNIKDRIEIEVTLKCKYEYEKRFDWMVQTYTIFIMEDAEGQQYKWNTTGYLAAEPVIDDEGNVDYQVPCIGDKFMLKGTVKGFCEYKGIPQVELTRCKCLEITHREPTEEEIADQKKQEQLDSLQDGDFIWRMPYKQYKEHYADCEAIVGSFERDMHTGSTIEVIIREGRLKASGVRGQHFAGYRLQNSKGEHITYRAVCEENAIKHAEKDYPDEVWECVEVYPYH